MTSLGNLVADTFEALSLYKAGKKSISTSEGLRCILCKFVLIDAYQTECGCRYCKECIEVYLKKGSNKCVGGFDECSKQIDRHIRDNATNREISKLTVPCFYDTCTFVGSLKGMMDHMKSCQYREETCSLCGGKCVSTEMKDHQATACSMRLEICPHCHDTFTHQDLKGRHLDVDSDELCCKYRQVCPYNCGLEKEVFLYEHRSVCTNGPKGCPFNIFGCHKVLSKDMMLDHLNAFSEKHLSMILGKIHNLESSNAEALAQIKRSNAEVYKLQEEVKRLENKFTKIEGKSMTEQVFKLGKYIWKVSNFNDLREDAKKGNNLTKLSDPFYTSDFGYKICLKMYLNGDGAGRGTHLSVFFVIMKGEYDDLLEWPFKRKIKISLLESSQKVSPFVEVFTADATSLCYIKPETECNIASGSPKFVPFSELNKYLSKEVLYLQIEVLP